MVHDPSSGLPLRAVFAVVGAVDVRAGSAVAVVLVDVGVGEALLRTAKILGKAPNSIISDSKRRWGSLAAHSTRVPLAVIKVPWVECKSKR